MGLGIKVPFGVDGKGYRQGLDKMRKQTKKWSGDIGGMVAGAFAVGAAVNVINEWVTGIKEAQKAATLLGTSAQEMERLKHIANKSKVEFDDLKEFISNVNERVFEGSIAAGHMADEWAALGLKAEELEGKTPLEQLTMLSDKFKESGDQSKFAAAGIALFGDDFKRALPALAQGGDKLREFAEEANVTSDKSLANIERIESAWADFKNFLAGLFSFVIGATDFIFTTIGAGWGFILRAGMETFQELGNMAEGFGDILMGVMTMDVEQIKKGAAGFNRVIDSVKQNALDNINTIKKSWRDIDAVSDEASGTTSNEAEKRYLSEIQDMREKIEKDEKKHAFEMMSLEEKKIALEKERFKIAIRLNDKTKDGLKARREYLENEKQLNKVSEKLEAKRAKEKEQRETTGKALFDKIRKVGEMQEKRRFEALTPAEKKKELKAKLEANKSAQTMALFKGQFDKLADLMTQEQSIKDELSKIKEKKPEPEVIGTQQSASIVASSLASVGGGGGVFAGVGVDPALDEARKQNQTLTQMKTTMEQVARNTSQTGGNPTTFRR